MFACVITLNLHDVVQNAEEGLDGGCGLVEMVLRDGGEQLVDIVGGDAVVEVLEHAVALDVVPVARRLPHHHPRQDVRDEMLHRAMMRKRTMPAIVTDHEQSRRSARRTGCLRSESWRYDE